MNAKEKKESRLISGTLLYGLLVFYVSVSFLFGSFQANAFIVIASLAIGFAISWIILRLDPPSESDTDNVSERTKPFSDDYFGK